MPFSSMTSYERLTAALRGQPVDRIPWSPFLAYWWEHQPANFQAKGQSWFFKEIGADALLRGFATAFSTSYQHGGCAMTETRVGSLLRTEYQTPLGTLVAQSRFSPDGNTIFVFDHPVKTKADFRILAHLVSEMIIRPNHAAVAAPIAELGQDGLLVALVSPFGKTPFQHMVEYWVGTEQLSFALADYPEEVEACLAVMSERAMEAVRYSVESPAEAFISWEDSSTTNVSPRMFARYIVPDIDRWGKEIHAGGKLFLHHACGHVRALMGSLAREEIDSLESLSPPPTGNIEIWEAQALLPAHIGLIGGIEPVQFLNLELPELDAYVETLLDRTNHNRYILANSDSCPPGVTVEKFRRVTEIACAWKA